MTRVVIELARPEDDAALREQARKNPMDGFISLAFLREPSFFEGSRLGGDFVQVNVGRETGSGQIVGMGTRAIRDGYLNGEPERIGYLSDLRLDREHRGGLVIARAYRHLAGLHADGRARIYQTVIVEGNQVALGTIASGRAGLPTYHDMGRLTTHAVVPIRRLPPVEGDFRIERGAPSRMAALCDCVNAHGAARQFGLRLSEADLDPATSRFRGLRPEDFFLAVSGETVLATVARWDQSAYKQTLVRGYSGPFALVRPIYNALAPVLGFAPYPAPGRLLHSFYAAFLACPGPDLLPARAVLRALYNDAVGRGTAWFLLGLHERDPLAVLPSEYWAATLDARLYAVTFPDDDEVRRGLDARVPHAEIALL